MSDYTIPTGRPTPPASDDTIPALTTAKMTATMVGRGDDLAQLHAALRNDLHDRAFRVVFVYGRGGLGKTRLLIEALRAAGHPNWPRPPGGPEWNDLNGTILSDLIDVIDLRLHDRHQFVVALRNSLMATTSALSYAQFDRAEDELSVLRGEGFQFDSISRAEEATSGLFTDSLRALAAERRVALFIDTVEQLDYIMSSWLIEQDKRIRKENPEWRGLLQADDLAARTHEWLARLVRGPVKPDEPGLENVTLVLAGRAQRGQNFFDNMRQAVNRANEQRRRVTLIDLPLRPLDRPQTHDYFAEQAREWAERGGRLSQRYAERIAADFHYLAADRDRSDTVWLLTGGVPVRLAMYAHLIAENHDIPAPLQQPFDELLEQARGKNNRHKTAEELVTEPTVELRRLQWDVEDAFVSLLFDQPTALQSRVLLALVRAPRGLTAEQIHYYLDADGRKPEEFRPDLRRMAEIEEVLQWLNTFYLGKRRASGEEFIANLPELRGEPVPFRLGLQDEIYDIFAEHIGLMSEPLTPETGAIRDMLSADEIRAYRQQRDKEVEERTRLYRRLSDWASFKLEHHLNQKREALVRDERELELRVDLEDTRTFRFLRLGAEDARRRAAINEAVATYEVERMVYLILVDLERNLNTEYINLGDDNARAGRESLDFWAQAEMWRTLHERSLMKFVNFRPRRRAQLRGETPLQVLWRFAKQEDVTRWNKRHALRANFDRAIEFGADLEWVIRNLPKAERNDYFSWTHTLLHGERVIWTSYAHILRSKDVEQAVKNIGQALKELHPLLANSVVERTKGRGLYAEYGFAGAGPDNPEHPAAVRLRRLMSHGYNWLGYGHRVLGQMEDAVENYGLALNYVRDDVGLMQAHRASILNNTSRALSELGWHSTPVCLNALQLRRELAEEVPLAQSYNTLALIYDDMGRYEDAPVLAAKAIAYSRRAGAKRQLGLSLRQMAESLRHVAIRMQTGQRMLATPDQLYTAAEDLLKEAGVLFSEVNEPSRAIEVLIERGSLYRDRLEPNAGGQRPRPWHDHYQLALQYLREADEMAADHGRHYHMDIHINIARVHYYAGELGLAEAELEGLLGQAYVRKHIIRSRGGRAIIPDPRQNRSLRDRAWAFRYLSTLYMVRGWIALNRFNQRVVFHKQAAEKQMTDPAQQREYEYAAVANDQEAQKQLRLAAEVYALGIAYAHLYSPRSRSISALENDLYDRLKAFNQHELRAFHDHLDSLRGRYEGLSSLDSLNDLLHKFLGYPN